MKEKNFSQQSLIELGRLQLDDFNRISQCRGKHNRLGYAYQLIFVKLLNNFPKIKPFEIIDEIIFRDNFLLFISFSCMCCKKNKGQCRFKVLMQQTTKSLVRRMPIKFFTRSVI